MNSWLRVPIRGGRMIIDLKSWSLYVSRKWHMNDSGYAVNRRGNPRITTRFHRLVAATPDDMITDHINHDRQDNREDNLRVGNYTMNARNLTDQGKGYWYSKNVRRWVVQTMGEYVCTCKTELAAKAIALAIQNNEPYVLPQYGRTDSDTHCKYGHSYAEVGFYFYPDGENRRKCKLCQKLRSAEWYQRKQKGMKQFQGHI